MPKSPLELATPTAYGLCSYRDPACLWAWLSQDLIFNSEVPAYKNTGNFPGHVAQLILV